METNVPVRQPRRAGAGRQAKIKMILACRTANRLAKRQDGGHGNQKSGGNCCPPKTANQLGRRNLTPEQMSMLRGRRYNRAKKAHGGDRKSDSRGQNVPLKTAERLANEHGVTSRTIKRDGQYAQAVDTLGNQNASKQPPQNEGFETSERTDLTSGQNATKFETAERLGKEHDGGFDFPTKCRKVGLKMRATSNIRTPGKAERADGAKCTFGEHRQPKRSRTDILSVREKPETP